MTPPLRAPSLQIYNEKKSQFQIKRNNPRDLVERVAQDISNLLHKKGKALGVRRRACAFAPPHACTRHTCSTDEWVWSEGW